MRRIQIWNVNLVRKLRGYRTVTLKSCWDSEPPPLSPEKGILRGGSVGAIGEVE